MLYCCFTAALLLLYCCFTERRQPAPGARPRNAALLLRLYCGFTAALLQGGNLL
jgi:hypothetical protein